MYSQAMAVPAESASRLAHAMVQALVFVGVFVAVLMGILPERPPPREGKAAAHVYSQPHQAAARNDVCQRFERMHLLVRWNGLIKHIGATCGAHSDAKTGPRQNLISVLQDAGFNVLRTGFSQ